MHFLTGSETAKSPVNPAGVEVAGEAATAAAPLRHRPGKALCGTLLLGLIEAIGLNVHVFSNAPQRTASYGLSEVLQIYSQGRTLDEQRPARLD
jgi:hypothetical protein